MKNVLIYIFKHIQQRRFSLQWYLWPFYFQILSSLQEQKMGRIEINMRKSFLVALNRKDKTLVV